jgi:hypothetical protein
MMDALTSATTFATVVGLVVQYVQSDNEHDHRSVEEFRNWLLCENHRELAELLNDNTKTTIAIKALLNLTRDEVATKFVSLSQGLRELMAGVEGLAENLAALDAKGLIQGQGGAGGGGKIIGNRGVIIGGRGGAGGVSGIGGAGGSGEIHGDGGMIIGGDGGNAGTADGRGGRGARGPTERLGFSTEIWGYGRGGSGTNAPEYDRRLSLLAVSREEYMVKFPFERIYIQAGIDQVPVDWINQRLAEQGEEWQVISLVDGGYVMPPLKSRVSTR